MNVQVFTIDFRFGDEQLTGHVTRFLDSQYPAIPDFRVTVDIKGFSDKVFTYYITKKGMWPLFWFPILLPEFTTPAIEERHARHVILNECIAKAIIERELVKS